MTVTLDKVIPALLESTGYLSKQDILTCRRVCKKWREAVDFYLEFRPAISAYNPELQNELFCLRKDLTECLEDDIDLERKPVFNRELGEVRLTSLQDDITFFQLFGMRYRQPEARSPFPAKLLSQWVGPDKNQRLSGIDAQSAPLQWIVTMRQSSQFGRFVHALKIGFDSDRIGDESVWLRFFRYLGHMTNLKYLKLMGGKVIMSHKAAKQFAEVLEFPSLPNLETIEISPFRLWFPVPILTRFIQNYSKQLRRLQVELKHLRFRNSSELPHLTELDIKFGETNEIGSDDYSSGEEETEDENHQIDTEILRRFLLKLNSPKLALARLLLKFKVKTELRIEQDVFQWLKRFQQLKSLHLGGYLVNLKETGGLDPSKDSHHSLQFLKIRDGFHLSYDFLQCLPSLQRLQVRVDQLPKVLDLSTEFRSGIRIKDQLQTGKLYESNVWNLCKKLRTVTVLSSKQWDGLKKVGEWDRANYDKVLGLEGRMESDYGLHHPIRKEILEFLEFNKNKPRAEREQEPSDSESYESSDSDEDVTDSDED